MKTFLEPDEVRRLTGRAWRSKQIAALRRTGVPFRVNDVGEIIVAAQDLLGRSKATTTDIYIRQRGLKVRPNK